MSYSGTGAAVGASAVARTARSVLLAALAAFVISTAWQALRSPWQVEDFPESLAIKVELMPVLFPLHMVTGGLALLLVPLALALNRYPRWHRRAARIAALDVVLAGVTAFPVALVAPVTWTSALGFCAQGLTWLVLLGLGLGHIRAGRVAQHRACMVLMAATMTGAVFFRVYLALWALYGTPRRFEGFYALDAWIAWTLPLGLAALWLKRTGGLRLFPR